MDHDYLVREFSHLAKRSLIYTCMVIAVLFNLLPFDKTILVLRPDFVALTLLYWNIYQPQQAGMGMAFIIGLVMDVVDGSIMGQHALAYCLITFFALVLHRRLRIFNVFQQIPVVLWVFFLAQLVVFLTGFLAGTYSPEWHFFLASVTGAFCWPLIVLVLGNFRKQRIDPDEL